MTAAILKRFSSRVETRWLARHQGRGAVVSLPARVMPLWKPRSIIIAATSREIHELAVGALSMRHDEICLSEGCGMKLDRVDAVAFEVRGRRMEQERRRR